MVLHNLLLSTSRDDASVDNNEDENPWVHIANELHDVGAKDSNESSANVNTRGDSVGKRKRVCVMESVKESMVVKVVVIVSS